jgi:hypothetical protein
VMLLLLFEANECSSRGAYGCGDEEVIAGSGNKRDDAVTMGRGEKMPTLSSTACTNAVFCC